MFALYALVQDNRHHETGEIPNMMSFNSMFALGMFFFLCSYFNICLEILKVEDKNIKKILKYIDFVINPIFNFALYIPIILEAPGDRKLLIFNYLLNSLYSNFLHLHMAMENCIFVLIYRYIFCR